MSGPSLDRPPRRESIPGPREFLLPRHALLRALVLAVFAIHALNYAAFFVDDEGIPFVYADHLLSGQGLVYNVHDGRVEGYSNFLHVLVATATVAAVKAVGAPRYAVFLVGKLLSLIAGVAAVWLIGRTLSRTPGIRTEGIVVGLALLALAPSLAAWSCSSLEMAWFALTVAILASALLGSVPDNRAALAATIVLFLLRIDGFVHAGAMLLGFWLVAEADRRRELVRRVIAPALAAFVVYHAWRVWYFRELLTLPLLSKVLPRMQPAGTLVVKLPETSYGMAFVRSYGAPFVLAAVALFAHAATVDRRARALFVAVSATAAYAALVSDWMMEFRFFVPVLIPAALLAGLALSHLRHAVGRAASAAAVLTVAWLMVVSLRAATTFDRLEYRDSWYRQRSLQPEQLFGPYWSAYLVARKVVRPGDLIADNQAGFLPFMLAAENIDDLGICSKFFAKLPASDLVVTEVGRYAMLTNRPALHAGHAYLLAREPTVVIARGDLLRAANEEHSPIEILASRYTAIAADERHETIVYGRTAEPVDVFRRDPTRFLENLANVSRLQHVVLNGQPVAPGEYVRDLPWLYDQTGRLQVDGSYSADVTFDTVDQPVYELHVDEVWADRAATLRCVLTDGAGRRQVDTTVDITAHRSRDLRMRFDQSIRARRLTVEVHALEGPCRVRLRDVRVQGQTPALARYVRENVPFRPSSR